VHVEVDHSALHARMVTFTATKSYYLTERGTVNTLGFVAVVFNLAGTAWNVTEDENGASSSEQQSITVGCATDSLHINIVG
jgi:hypothetical protein